MATPEDDASEKCSQSGEPVTVPQPLYDPFFTANERVIQDLLIDEKRYHSTPGYCVKQVFARSKWMRRTLFNWLRDVCTFRQTDGGVLAHTAQLIDRYLHVAPTDKREYQLVGATCLFISSKLKETVPVSLDKLVQYTDYSATPDDILAKELTICISLEWDLSCITPIDFIAPIVDFLEFVPSLRQIIRQASVSVYIKIFHVEDLNTYLPSYVSAACILYAINLTVHQDLTEVALRSVVRIQQLLQLDAHKIREVFETLQACFEPGTVDLSKAVLDVDNHPPLSPSSKPTDRLDATHQSFSNILVSSDALLLPLAASNYCVSSHPTSSLSMYDVSSQQQQHQQQQQQNVSNSASACSTSSPSESDLAGPTDIDS